MIRLPVAALLAACLIVAALAASTAAHAATTEETLEALKSLHEQGVLSDEEYERKRREVLEPKPKSSKAAGSAEPADVAAALAGLKLMHDQGLLTDEEYMRKQREVINAHTKKTREGLGVTSTSAAAAGEGSAAAPGRFRVAVLPIAHHTSMAYSTVDEVLYRHTAQLINSEADLTLVFAENDPQFKPGSAGTGATVWGGSFTKKTPVETQALAGAKRVGANVAVMFAHTKRTAGWYGDDFIFDMYIFDLEKGTKIYRQGDELDFGPVIDKAFADLVANRGS